MTTVLIVDDDPHLLDAMGALVESGGFRVVKALDGIQAMQLARTHTPAIVVTDYMMPRMNGSALIAALASDPQLAHIPVVLTSALATPPATLEIVAFLRKPFPAARLLELLREHVGPAARADRED